MITGVVTADHQVVIPLTVRGPTGQEQEIEAIIDTGFDGWLSLPSSLIALLGLVWRQRGRTETTPLVGMSLLEGYELTVDVRPSGNVIIRAFS